MSKSIAIVGGGIAGLSAGCYGRMNGYQTTIFEMHDLPGGQCTAWTRNGYTIDGCIHWLVGSSSANSFNKVWRELGAVQGRKRGRLPAGCFDLNAPVPRCGPGPNPRSAARKAA